MAKVKIQGTASGTGILTVTSPNTSTDRTITLPDATGTLSVEGLHISVIVMWSGAITNIPAGWVICDGTNGTPNLTDRFVIHADADSGGTRNVNAIGGSHTSGAHTLSTSEIPSHTHTYTRFNIEKPPNDYYWVPSDTSVWNGTTSISTGSTGSGGSHTHTAIPQFHALAYIMKT